MRAAFAPLTILKPQLSIASPMASLSGPHGLFNVSAMPRFLLDSCRIGWQGSYFTDIICAPDGTVQHGHERYCIQRGMHGEMRRALGKSTWQEFGTGFSVWRAGDEQNLCWRGEGRSQFLFIAPEQAELMLGHSRPLKVLGQKQASRSRVLELLFDALQSDLAQGSPAGPLVGDSLITALVAHLGGQDELPASTGQARRACDRAIDLIESRFAEAVTLRALADTAGMGSRHFCRSFRRATGKSPHQYLLQRRVEQAKLLIARGLALADVAAQCGFADQSQLTRTFARQVGATPGRYRNSLLR